MAINLVRLLKEEKLINIYKMKKQNENSLSCKKVSVLMRNKSNEHQDAIIKLLKYKMVLQEKHIKEIHF